MTYAAQEKYLLAEQPFQRACNIDPKEPDVCYYWGRTLYSLSRFDAALRAYERDRRPWQGKTFLGMALAMEALDRDSRRRNCTLKPSGPERNRRPRISNGFRGSEVPRSSSPEILFDPRDLPVTVRNGATGDKR
jgi:hypothetical protein